MERDRIVIIDGNSLINRAYYAIQRPMITKEGLYTQAVYGFLTMLNKIKTDYQPEYLTVTFDRKAPTFRHREYDAYKAGRKGMPPELAMQLPLLKEVLSAMNIAMLEIDGFEADDIIGTVARRGEEAGLAPLIITGDRDALQLATDVTTILLTKKGISEFELYDRQAMMDKYGFTPEQFIDFKGLMGDSSDNIPGLPGVGEKTAQKLILQFGSVAELIRRTDEISSAKLREKVEENAELAVMSRRLATIVTEVPIEVDFEACRVREADEERLIECYRKLEFNSFLKKMTKGAAEKSSARQAAASPKRSGGVKSGMESDIEFGAKPQSEGTAEGLPVQVRSRPLVILREAAEVKQLEAEAKGEGLLLMKTFGDDNHRGDPLLEGITLQTQEHSYYADGANDQVMEALKELFRSCDAALGGHGLKKDYYALMAQGFSLSNHPVAFDTSIGQYLLQPSRSSYDLDVIALELGISQLSSEKTFAEENEQMTLFTDGGEINGRYGQLWCSVSEAVRDFQKQKIEDEGLQTVLETIELPLISVMASMEHWGIAVDRQELKEMGERLKEGIQLCQERIYQAAGETFNINSPKQLGVVLFEKLGLPGAKKTKTGYATGAEILERLAGDYPIVADILEFRQLSKLNSTYVEGLLPLIDSRGKIHAHFQQTVTATGRISCTEPNLQNIPIRQELGRQLRRVFVPESDDYIFVGADYSQIELRVLAHLSGDPSLIEAFNQGEDIHRSTASRVFNVPTDEVTALQRSNAKAVNFGVIYGMSGFGLSNNLNITRKEAEAYIAEYFRKYSRVKEYMDQLVKSGRENGWVATMMGRRRSIPEINASNYMVRQAGERLAMNSPIQGTAADIIKIAMIQVDRALREECSKSHLLLQVHDELIIQAHKSELEQVKELLRRCMESAVEMKVKLLVDLHTGDSWFDLK